MIYIYEYVNIGRKDINLNTKNFNALPKIDENKASDIIVNNYPVEKNDNTLRKKDNKSNNNTSTSSGSNSNSNSTTTSSSTSKNNNSGDKNDYNNIDPRKRKRRRTSHDEQILLDSFFRKNHFPNAALRQILSADTGMSARAVQIWFQNRRQAERKKKTKNHNNMNMNLGLRMNLGMNMGFGFGMGLGLPLMNLPMQRPNANILPSTNVINNNSNNNTLNSSSSSSANSSHLKSNMKQQNLNTSSSSYNDIKSLKNEAGSDDNQINLDMKNNSDFSLQMPVKSDVEKNNISVYPKSVSNKSTSYKSNYSKEKKGPQPILPKHLISTNTNPIINKNEKNKIKTKLNDSSKNIDLQSSSLNRYSAIAPSFNNDSSMKDNTFSIFKKESNNTISQKNIPILPNTFQYTNMFNNNKKDKKDPTELELIEYYYFEF